MIYYMLNGLWVELSSTQLTYAQQVDFYEPDLLPVTQPIVSKHYRKTHTDKSEAKKSKFWNHMFKALVTLQTGITTYASDLNSHVDKSAIT